MNCLDVNFLWNQVPISWQSKRTKKCKYKKSISKPFDIIFVGIIYDVIVEPPSVGSTTDEFGHSKPVSLQSHTLAFFYTVLQTVRKQTFVRGLFFLMLSHKLWQSRFKREISLFKILNFCHKYWAVTDLLNEQHWNYNQIHWCSVVFLHWRNSENVAMWLCYPGGTKVQRK